MTAECRKTGSFPLLEKGQATQKRKILAKNFSGCYCGSTIGMLGPNLFDEPRLLPQLAGCFLSKLKTFFTGLLYNEEYLGKSRQLDFLGYTPDKSQP